MQVDIQCGPAFAFGTITLPPGGSVEVEAGAMAAMSGGVEIATASRGGMLGGLKRSVLGRRELLHQHLHGRQRRAASASRRSSPATSCTCPSTARRT